jgi:hypothetical protein
MNQSTEIDPQDVFTTVTSGLAEASRPRVIRLEDGDRFDIPSSGSAVTSGSHARRVTP